MNHDNKKEPNQLINSSSPYLIQHAYNPVDWHEWNAETLKKAKELNKPIIVSIGYSACHWCHVMERESFENEEVAKVMNENFLCIKVDREERPDIDQIYMEAVQLMGINGGWPLNVLLLPDGRPFYGGTYFPKKHWTNMLEAVTKALKEKPEEIEQSANELAQGIARSEIQKYGMTQSVQDFQKGKLEEMFEKLASKFDTERGGMNRAPKFPMPSIYSFLLRYHFVSGNEQALRQTKTTLDEMAFGGIYDQAGGGFARYSTDSDWLVPHFEKMLYDNAQLVTVYSEAYNLTKLNRYKEVVYETVGFIEREMTLNSGGFYSALDADSEGEEGKFYVWSEDELKGIIDADEFALFADYYQIRAKGNWEEGKNILHRKSTDEAFAQKHSLDLAELQKKVGNWKKAILKARSPRIRPGLDDKVLTSWNGLMLKGLATAYTVFGDKKFLQMAEKNANFLNQKITENGKLSRNFKDGKVSIQAYLEDYATVIDGYLSLYQANFDAKWLYEAEKLTNYTIENFYDSDEGLFFFTDKTGEKLIARKKEIFDNVIPASNSIMAQNLYQLGLLLDNSEYSDLAKQMLGRVNPMLGKEVNYLTNWASLYTNLVEPTVEVAIVGKDYEDFAHSIQQNFHPNRILVATKQNSDDSNTNSNSTKALPLLRNRTAIDGKTTIYVCREKACKLPVQSVEKALEQIKP